MNMIHSVDTCYLVLPYHVHNNDNTVLPWHESDLNEM